MFSLYLQVIANRRHYIDSFFRISTCSFIAILFSSIPIYASSLVQAIEIGPLPYLQQSDSPFDGQSFDYFHLEDFEDNVFNVPGATQTPTWGSLSTLFTDSVDGDDGIVDGSGQSGGSYWSDLSYEFLTVSYDIGVLGNLPTHVGVVWTDVGRNGGGAPLSFPLPVTFEFTGPDGIRLDSGTTHLVGDGLVTGQTDEDRFFGAINTSGISSMTLRMPGLNNWELDHVQYGFQSNISTCNGLPITVDLNSGQTPGPGDDVVMGTQGNDDIRGRAGNDTICGMGGDDFIHGNSGDDWIDGGAGVDNLRGGQGNDIIYAGSGATVGHPSRIFGGTGDDMLFGGVDADDLRGGRGADTLEGAGSDDELRGNQDDDILFGRQDNDTLLGGDGHDELNGNAGNDVLNGGAGALDICDGGNGNNDSADASCENVFNVP